MQQQLLKDTKLTKEDERVSTDFGLDTSRISRLHTIYALHHVHSGYMLFAALTTGESHMQLANTSKYCKLTMNVRQLLLIDMKQAICLKTLQ